VAQDLDLTESACANGWKQADVDAGNGPLDALTTAEKEELRQLRRENRQLRQHRDILKAAATFFAKEKQ
jgi:transposase